MTNLKLAAICAIILPNIASADIEIDTSIDFTTLNRGAFVDALDGLTQAMWEPTFTLFARLDPSISDAIPPYQRGDEFREIHGCIFDVLSEQDAIDDVNTLRDGSLRAVAYIEAHPELNVGTIADHDEYLEHAVPPDAYVLAAQSCGLFDLNSDIMKNAGLVELMREVAENAN
ncbi:hypothetical protein MACH17_12080 [Phaeobacter inhibens]|uniref:hypothetical protein n=1 Tax=Phaeobacter inhibens TaxID=221822 RepID=UPI0027714522|nr:hypothetical protein [Phaeobacter inhibens]GLO69691.1 hypothetical protein MACH17_12080 [Phaeobacter inhibens]